MMGRNYILAFDIISKIYYTKTDKLDNIGISNSIIVLRVKVNSVINLFII